MCVCSSLQSMSVEWGRKQERLTAVQMLCSTFSEIISSSLWIISDPLSVRSEFLRFEF